MRFSVSSRIRERLIQKKSRTKRVESKETINQNESKLIGATNLSRIVERFYGPLCQFAVGLTKSESEKTRGQIYYCAICVVE